MRCSDCGQEVGDERHQCAAYEPRGALKISIVLVSGKQGSGKSTLQNLLVRTFKAQNSGRNEALAINFADPLYKIHSAVREVAYHYGLQPKMPKDGRLLQLLGTEWGRSQYGENVWADVLKKTIDRNVTGALSGPVTDHILFVVGDCRFRNEFDFFPDAIKVRLEAPMSDRKARCSQWRETDEHPSEVDLDPYVLEGKFDMLFHTHERTVDYCTEKILKEISGRMSDKPGAA